MSEPREPDVDLAFLIQRARAGESRAFERLVRRYRDLIFRWALVRTGDEDDAEDATQETLVRLYLGLRKFRGASRLETWLYAITRSAATDVLRRRKRQHRVLETYSSQAETESGSRAEPLDRLAARRITDLVGVFLGDLPARQREAIDLVDLQGLQPSEAAARLGSNPATLRTHLFRGRRALRGRLLSALPDHDAEAR